MSTTTPWLLPKGQLVYTNHGPIDVISELNKLLAEVGQLREVVGNYRARLTEAEAQIVKLASACEDALSYFEQSWKQVGEHPHAAEAPYVEDLREALGK